VAQVERQLVLPGGGAENAALDSFQVSAHDVSAPVELLSFAIE